MDTFLVVEQSVWYTNLFRGKIRFVNNRSSSLRYLESSILHQELIGRFLHKGDDCILRQVKAKRLKI